MKRLIKKMPHRQRLENYLLAYASEDKKYNGRWKATGQSKTENGIRLREKCCEAGGSRCNIGDACKWE